jgi:hypothetical protein
MENCYKLDVPLKVDINFGDNWYQAKWYNWLFTIKMLLL